MEAIRFVLIDETIVSYGYWVSVSGIDLVQFRKNPIMYWMHQRSSRWGDKEQVLPIGKWKDIKVELINGIKSITAEPVFDIEDEFALKIKNKVDGGFIKMASAGLAPKQWSEDKKHLKPGQTRATVLKSQMVECSIVDIGANKNAIRLYDETGVINLSEGNENIIPLINLNLNLKSESDMKLIALALGLDAETDEAVLLAEIKRLQTAEKENKTALEQFQAEKVEELMEHESITEKNKAQFEELAGVNFGLAKTTLDLMRDKEPKKKPKRALLADAIDENRKPSTNSEKTWEELSEEELQELKADNTEEYETLYEAEFGHKPKY